MRWLVFLLIFVRVATGQPELVERVRGARTPAELSRIVDEWLDGESMSKRSITWDAGEAVTGGLVSTFDRDTSAFDLDHQVSEADAVVSAADTRRYGGDVVVYGAPTPETVADLAGSYRPYAAGLDASGLPVIVSNYRGTPTLTVYRGGSTVSVLNAITLLGGANKPSANIGDMLSGQADEEADYTHDPRGAVCLPGIILWNCCCHKYDGTGSRTDSANYVIDGVSLVYSTDNGATRHLAGRLGGINGVTPPTDYGSEWAITATHLARDGTNSTFRVTVATYSSGGSRGADSVLFEVSGGVGAWTVSQGYRIPHADGSATNTHEHYGIQVRDPANALGIKYLAELGDSAPDNRTEEWLCSSEANWLAGASAVANSVNVLENGSNWTGPTKINGKTGAGAANEWMSSQTISYAPGPNGGWYAGSDEGASSPIMYATVPATNGARVNWLHAYGAGGTMLGGASGANPNEANWRCFTLNAWDYSAVNPAVAGFISPGSNWPTGYHDAARIVYKPEGETAFGVVYAPQDEESMGSQLRPVIAPDGYIYFGTSNAHGLRRIPVPSSSRTRIQKAVYAGPGGNNIALATPVQVTAPGSGNTVTIGTETAPATAPTTAATMHFTAGTASVGVGAWRITADAMTKTHATLTVQVLVYTDTIAADSNADTLWRARFYTVEGTTTLATLYRGPNRIETRGHFTLLTYVLKNGAGADDDWNLSALTAPLQLVMQMQMSSAVVHPGEWWQWFVGVYEDLACPPPYLVPPATNGDHETLEISGFACGQAWAAGLVGVMGGETGRDCRYHNADTFREFGTLWEDANTYLELAWDADDQVRLKATDGASTATATLTGFPKFLRGDPFLFAVDYDGSNYHYALSIAGCEARTGTLAPAGAVVKPTKILPGQDDDGTVRETTRWLHAAVHDADALGADGLLEFVESGSMSIRPGGRSRGRMRRRARSAL